MLFFVPKYSFGIQHTYSNKFCIGRSIFKTSQGESGWDTKQYLMLKFQS